VGNHFAVEAVPSVVQHTLEAVAVRLGLVVAFWVDWVHTPFVARQVEPLPRHAQWRAVPRTHVLGPVDLGPAVDCLVGPGSWVHVRVELQKGHVQMEQKVEAEKPKHFERDP
jgi:hypothetical protein